MATHELTAQTIVAQTNLTGGLEQLQTEGAFMTADSVANTLVRARLQTPPDDPLQQQTVTVRLRKSAPGGNNPSATVRVLQGGSTLASANNVAVTSDAGQTVTLTFTNPPDVTGAGIELEVSGSSSGGPTNNRRAVDVGHMLWTGYNPSDEQGLMMLLQWTLQSPTDWEAHDFHPLGKRSRIWDVLPKKAPPGQGGEIIDNEKGWLYGWAIGGIILDGYDGYSAELAPPHTLPHAVTFRGGDGRELSWPAGHTFEWGVRTICWNDDPDQYPAGQRWARRMDFYPPGLIQLKTYFAEANAPVMALGPHTTTSGHATIYRPWSEFSYPPASRRIYGKQLPEGLNQEHATVRSVPSYELWLNNG